MRLFSQEQRQAAKDLVALLRDADEADSRYNAISDSKGGSIISTDIARFLDRRYADTPEGQERDLAPSWRLAWRYAQARFERELRNRGQRETVRFMAGGLAAGKTHALEKEATKDLAWDGTLSNPIWATGQIDIALKNGWEVEIVYVYRALELAFYGAIERGHKEGRHIPLENLAVNHKKVQEAIIELSAIYMDEPGVTFLFLHNIGTERVRRRPIRFEFSDIDDKGGLRYSSSYESYYSRSAPSFAEEGSGV